MPWNPSPWVSPSPNPSPLGSLRPPTPLPLGLSLCQLLLRATRGERSLMARLTMHMGSTIKTFSERTDGCVLYTSKYIYIPWITHISHI